MRILIDADGCPVVDECIKIAREFDLEVVIFCDTSHYFEKDNVKTVFISKGVDAVDFAILNNINKYDIVVTQDYGLASLVLSRNCYAINQNGMEYTSQNIDMLLNSRYISKKIRNSGGRLKGPKKREKEANDKFSANFRDFIKKIYDKRDI